MRHAVFISITSLWLGCVMFAGEVTESYDITFDGKKFSVVSGTVTNLTVGGKTVAVGVEKAQFKRFNDGILSFLFPGDFSAEKEESEELTSWTLDGHDTVIMLHKLQKGIDPVEFADDISKDLVKTYGKGTKLERCERQFGSKVVKGKRIKMKIAGESLVQEIFSITGGTSNYVFVIQEDEEKTPEAKLVGDKLKETFQIKSGK